MLNFKPEDPGSLVESSDDLEGFPGGGEEDSSESNDDSDDDSDEFEDNEEGEGSNSDTRENPFFEDSNSDSSDMEDSEDDKKCLLNAVVTWHHVFDLELSDVSWLSREPAT